MAKKKTPVKNPRGPNPPRPLTLREQRFVAEYVLDMNGRKAIERAGGYPKSRWNVTPTELLKREDIKTAVAVEQKKRLDSAAVSAEEVLKELAMIGLCDPAGIFTEAGQVLAVHQMPLGVRKSIASIETETATVDGVPLFHTKVRFWDKNAALQTLAKHLQLLKEQQQVEGTVHFVWDDSEDE